MLPRSLVPCFTILIQPGGNRNWLVQLDQVCKSSLIRWTWHRSLLKAVWVHACMPSLCLCVYTFIFTNRGISQYEVECIYTFSKLAYNALYFLYTRLSDPTYVAFVFHLMKCFYILAQYRERECVSYFWHSFFPGRSSISIACHLQVLNSR